MRQGFFWLAGVHQVVATHGDIGFAAVLFPEYPLIREIEVVSRVLYLEAVSRVQTP